jgi:hypothetical protein
MGVVMHAGCAAGGVASPRARLVCRLTKLAPYRLLADHATLSQR